MKKMLFAFLIVSLFSGCLKNSSSNYTCTYEPCGVVAPDAEIQQVKNYLTDSNINATQHCSGLFYTIDDPGTGTKPTVCNNVAVTYEGKLTDGTRFDGTSTPVVFNLSGLITGFKN